jgi:inosose dehydratase
MKLAGAPISWGASELPDWGYRMLPERVLGEMRALGLHATEFGPPGFLPSETAELRDMLARHGLRLAAGFLAAVLHEAPERALEAIRRHADRLVAAGADVLVLAAALPGDSYDRHERLNDTAWSALVESLRAADQEVSRRGLTLAFHPHAGTAIERAEDLSRLIEGSDVGLCLDTGHLFLGGAEPVEVLRAAGARVRHVHLKDVARPIAERVRSGRLPYAAAVRSGLYRPLGEGHLDIAAVVQRLNATGYEGWYVLEQDTVLTAEPGPHGGPADSARRSLEYFESISSAKRSASPTRVD